MEIIDGKIVSQRCIEKLKEKIIKFSSRPSLSVIRIGNDPASEVYVRLKKKMCEEIGIDFTEYHLNTEISQKDLEDLIDKLNLDNTVNAILLQSPIPAHLNIMQAFRRISPEKDVDGFCSVNVGKLVQGDDCFVACTPLGIMTLLKEYGIETCGKNAVVIGRSNIVGRPMAQLLLNADSTVTVCHSKTKNLSNITKTADILVVAVGKPNFVTSEMVKDGAVVIDVGINRVSNSKKVIGDVDFENVKNKCSYITPVPGGVGPMTIATLMENTVKAYEKQRGIV